MKLKTFVYLCLITLVTSFYLPAHAQSRVSPNPPRALAATPSGSWPQPRFDAAQTGYNPDESILSRDTIKDLVLDWQLIASDPDDRQNFQTPVVADNMVFFPGRYGLYALDAGTGKTLWGGPSGGIAPAVANGVVYVAGPLVAYVYALNENTGVVLWRYPIAGGASSPTVADGAVYVTSGEYSGSQVHYLYALNATTGSILWRYPAPIPIFSPPAVANGVVYMAADNVYALDATTGALIWKSPISVDMPSPAVANGVVYVVSKDSYLYALNAGTGATIWKYYMGGSQYSPAVANGVVYVGSNDHNLYAVNAATGAFIWKFATGNQIESSPAVANGIVYINSVKIMYAVDANNGRALWDYWTGVGYSSSPVVANGMVYLGIGQTISALHLPGEIPPGFSVIHNFDMEDRSALAGVTLKNGALWGMAGAGLKGPFVFEMMPWGDGWTYAPIAPLTAGNSPNSRLVFGPDGNPYSTTYYNEINYSGYGLVYNLTPESLNGTTAKEWHQNVLYQFRGSPDGAYPSNGDLLWDQQGHIYGTTVGGGSSNNGTVYQMTCSGKNCTEQVIYSFLGDPDGKWPQNGVVFDSAGNLYGTTQLGGSYGHGTVFQLKYVNGSWTETVLYNFTGDSDGGSPYAGVIFDQYGNLYGATPSGGSSDEGTVFELSPSGDTWTFNLLYSFPLKLDTGCGPAASLVMDSAGNLYGSSRCGSIYFDGTFFKLTKTGDTWDYTLLHDFGTGVVNGQLAIDANGTLYGAESLYSGQGGLGSIWLFKQ